jgi:hypothetical protein
VKWDEVEVKVERRSGSLYLNLSLNLNLLRAGGLFRQPAREKTGCALVREIGRMRLMKALHYRDLARMIHERFYCNRRSAALARET